MKKLLVVSVLIVSLLTSCGFFGQQETKVEPTRDPLISQLATSVAELQIPQDIVAPTPIPTPVQSAQQPSQDCPPAADLGPWAPNGSSGENFEVTCNETVCSGTHVQLWWPGGSNQVWEKKEISVFIPKGLSIEVQKGAGRGWEYSLGCNIDEINRQIQGDNSRRLTDTSFFGQVKIDDLIKTGLVVVRFDRRVNPT